MHYDRNTNLYSGLLFCLNSDLFDNLSDKIVEGGNHSNVVYFIGQ